MLHGDEMYRTAEWYGISLTYGRKNTRRLHYEGFDFVFGGVGGNVHGKYKRYLCQNHRKMKGTGRCKMKIFEKMIDGKYRYQITGCHNCDAGKRAYIQKQVEADWRSKHWAKVPTPVTPVVFGRSGHQESGARSSGQPTKNILFQQPRPYPVYPPRQRPTQPKVIRVNDVNQSNFFPQFSYSQNPRGKISNAGQENRKTKRSNTKEEKNKVYLTKIESIVKRFSDLSQQWHLLDQNNKKMNQRKYAESIFSIIEALDRLPKDMNSNTRTYTKNLIVHMQGMIKLIESEVPLRPLPPLPKLANSVPEPQTPAQTPSTQRSGPSDDVFETSNSLSSPKTSTFIIPNRGINPEIRGVKLFDLKFQQNRKRSTAVPVKAFSPFGSGFERPEAYPNDSINTDSFEDAFKISEGIRKDEFQSSIMPQFHAPVDQETCSCGENCTQSRSHRKRSKRKKKPKTPVDDGDDDVEIQQTFQCIGNPLSEFPYIDPLKYDDLVIMSRVGYVTDCHNNNYSVEMEGRRCEGCVKKRKIMYQLNNRYAKYLEEITDLTSLRNFTMEKYKFGSGLFYREAWARLGLNSNDKSHQGFVVYKPQNDFERDLLQGVLECFDNGNIRKDNFFSQFLKVQIENASKSNSKSYVYSDEFYYYTILVKYYTGKTCRQLLGGLKNAGLGRKNSENNTDRINFYFPSDEALRSFQPKPKYGLNFNEEVLKSIDTSIENEKCSKYFFLHWDEISIVSELNTIVIDGEVYVVGCPDIMSFDQFKIKYDLAQQKKTKFDMSDKILQVYITSIEGKSYSLDVGHWCLPLNHQKMKKFKVEKLREIINHFHSKCQGRIIGGSSDGATENSYVYEELKKSLRSDYDLPFFGIFDFVHSLKNMRNLLLNHKITPFDYHVSIYTVIDFIRDNYDEEFYEDFNYEALHPVDRMRFDLVKELWKLNGRLLNSNTPKYRDLGKFLNREHQFYQIFMNKSGSNDKYNDRVLHVDDEDDVFQKMLEIDLHLKYLEEWYRKTNRTTVSNRTESLEELKDFIKFCSENGVKRILLSNISSLNVELHFSVIRRKYNYPNAKSYTNRNNFTSFINQLVQSIKCGNLNISLPANFGETNNSYFNNNFEIEPPKLEKRKKLTSPLTKNQRKEVHEILKKHNFFKDDKKDKPMTNRKKQVEYRCDEGCEVYKVVKSGWLIKHYQTIHKLSKAEAVQKTFDTLKDDIYNFNKNNYNRMRQDIRNKQDVDNTIMDTDEINKIPARTVDVNFSVPDPEHGIIIFDLEYFIKNGKYYILEIGALLSNGESVNYVCKPSDGESIPENLLHHVLAPQFGIITKNEYDQNVRLPQSVIEEKRKYYAEQTLTEKQIIQNFFTKVESGFQNLSRKHVFIAHCLKSADHKALSSACSRLRVDLLNKPENHFIDSTYWLKLVLVSGKYSISELKGYYSINTSCSHRAIDDSVDLYGLLLKYHGNDANFMKAVKDYIARHGKNIVSASNNPKWREFAAKKKKKRGRDDGSGDVQPSNKKRKAECPHCKKVYSVNKGGKIRKHGCAVVTVSDDMPEISAEVVGDVFDIIENDITQDDETSNGVNEVDPLDQLDDILNDDMADLDRQLDEDLRIEEEIVDYRKREGVFMGNFPPRAARQGNLVDVPILSLDDSGLYM